MTRRRSLLLASLAGPCLLASAHAQQRKSIADPLRLGVDVALVESGLAKALQKAFGRDTGVAVQLVPGPAVPLLEALERGELDAALSNAPDAELRLDKQGLVHDRRLVAIGALVLVGPLVDVRAGSTPKGATPGKPQATTQAAAKNSGKSAGKSAVKARPMDPAGLAGGHDVTLALQQLASAAATPGSVQFLSAGDGSGTHAAEQVLWRAAKVAPAEPWYVMAEHSGKAGSLPAQARARGTYALVERGSWAAQGGVPLVPLVEGDPLLDVPVHVMRSFRVNHPAAKIFVGWITGPKGARVVAGHHGYRAPTR